ncbi:hypothetical protein DAPPUDRAFT_313472 [Daphnia pulex]|uniref:Uncharacterized protein n=1 Tax=Daphnia pulex TaxID=6669 RepID=E9G386_DAPPU|nr:hypothetical protein DAPPUDRAFT_313472 [Daphnia pulex]|eukprot:EFX85729.1 hypothetical protein DAPPUDRAFT_313472 [Daphnia pulex]
MAIVATILMFCAVGAWAEDLVAQEQYRPAYKPAYPEPQYPSYSKPAAYPSYPSYPSYPAYPKYCDPKAAPKCAENATVGWCLTDEEYPTYEVKAVYPHAKMNEQVKTFLSWFPFLWDKKEVELESPEKENNLIDFGEQEVNGGPNPTIYNPYQQWHVPSSSHHDGFMPRPPPPSVIPPTSPGSFPNMMDRLEQLENRIEACERETLEFQAQLNEIKVETNDLYQNHSEPANPTEVEMDVYRKELQSNPIMLCTMPIENVSPPFLPPPSSATENPFTPYGYGGL